MPRTGSQTARWSICLLLTVLFWACASVAATEPTIELTPEERAWLDRHPQIRLATLTDYPPFSMTAPDGAHIGILADVM